MNMGGKRCMPTFEICLEPVFPRLSDIRQHDGFKTSSTLFIPNANLQSTKDFKGYNIHVFIHEPYMLNFPPHPPTFHSSPPSSQSNQITYLQQQRPPIRQQVKHPWYNILFFFKNSKLASRNEPLPYSPFPFLLTHASFLPTYPYTHLSTYPSIYSPYSPYPLLCHVWLSVCRYVLQCT